MTLQPDTVVQKLVLKVTKQRLPVLSSGMGTLKVDETAIPQTCGPRFNCSRVCDQCASLSR